MTGKAVLLQEHLAPNPAFLCVRKRPDRLVGSRIYSHSV